jgi:PAS domain S-box-containing protein
MKKKIIISLFALFIILTVGTVIAVVYMSSNTSELRNIVKLHEVEELRRSLIIKIQNVHSYLYTYNTAISPDLDLIVSQAASLDETAKKCSSCHHPKKLSERIENMQSLIQDYKKALSYYMTTSANTERIEKLKLDATAIGKNLIVITGEMSHSASKNIQDLTNDAMLRMNNVSTILFITIIVTFLLGIMVAVHLTKSVTKPINELVNATRKIASGEFGSTISYKDGDEFGELSKHFNTMSTTIKEGYENIQKEITEHRQTEEALRESEEKLKSVFNHMQDVFYRTDKEDRITWVSPSALNMLGYKSVDELIGHDFSEFYLFPEKRKLFLKELSNKGTATNYEVEMLRSDRSTIIVSTNSHFYLDKNGEVAGVEGTCRDITERKKIEEEHRKIEKLESVGIMAGGIAHDFNNILTAIAGNIALAKLSAYPENRLSEILKDAEKACLHAKNLTNQLLTFSKGGAPVKKITHVGGLLRDSASFALRGSNVKCIFSIPDYLWPVEIDEGQITQVIHNLIINAHQAMPDGGTIKVLAENVTAEVPDVLPIHGKEYIKVSIKDNGIGIPKEDIIKIFDPYFTTKQKGSGLGLASTYSIIKNHNGYIDANSDIGKGTTFNIYLPASREKPPFKDKKSDKILKGTGNILIMDDEDTVRKTVGKMMEHLGYEVEIVKDGHEAINLYKKAKESSQPFDTVIMDLTVRNGMGGKETIKNLLEIDPGVKAIVSSGYSNDPIMADFKKYGFTGVITKPFEIKELSEVLHKVIKGSN